MDLLSHATLALIFFSITHFMVIKSEAHKRVTMKRGWNEPTGRVLVIRNIWGSDGALVIRRGLLTKRIWGLYRIPMI